MSKIIPSSPTVSFITETRTTLEAPQPGGNKIIGSFQASSILVDRKWVEPDEVQAEIFMPTAWALAHLPSAEAKSVAGKARYVEVAQPIGVSRVFLLEEADVQPLDGGEVAKVSIKGRSPESWLEIVPTTINRSLQEPFSPTDTWADYARTIVDLYAHDGTKYSNRERINGVEFRALPILNLGTDFKSMVVSEMDELGVFAPQMTSLPGKPSIKAGVLPPTMRDLEFPSPAGKKLWEALKSYGYADGNETLLTSVFELVLVRAESPYKDGTLWWKWAFHPRTDASLFVSTVGGSADGEMVIHVSSTTQQTLAVPPEEGGLTKQSSTYGSTPLIGTWNATTMKTVEVSQAEGRPVTPAERAYFRSIGKPIPDSVTEWTPSLVSLTMEQIRREAQAGDLTIAPSITIDVDANGDSTEIGLKKLSSLRPGMKATVRVSTSTLSYEIDEVLYSYEAETGWSVKAPLTIKTDAMKITYPYDYTIDSYDKDDTPTQPPQPDFPPYVPVPEPEPPGYPEPPVAPEDPDPSVPVPEPGSSLPAMSGTIKRAWGWSASRAAFVQLENGKWLAWNAIYETTELPEIFEMPSLKDYDLIGADIIWGDSDANQILEGVFKKGKRTFVVAVRPGLKPEEPNEITGREILCASGMVTLDETGVLERQDYDWDKKSWSRVRVKTGVINGVGYGRINGDLMIRMTPEIIKTGITKTGDEDIYEDIVVFHNDAHVLGFDTFFDQVAWAYDLDEDETYKGTLIVNHYPERAVISTSKGIFLWNGSKWVTFEAPDGPTIERVVWHRSMRAGLVFTPSHVYKITYSSSSGFTFKEIVAGHFLGGDTSSEYFDSVILWGKSGLYELLLSENGKTWEKKQIDTDSYSDFGWAKWKPEIIGLHPGSWMTMILSGDKRTVKWRAVQTSTEATLWSGSKDLSFEPTKMETSSIECSAFWNKTNGSVFVLSKKPGTDDSYEIDQQDIWATGDIAQILTVPASMTALVINGESVTLPDGTAALENTIAAEAKPKVLSLGTASQVYLGTDRGAYELSLPRQDEKLDTWLKRTTRVSRRTPSVAEIQAIAQNTIVGKEEGWHGVFTSSTQLLALKDGEKIYGTYTREDGIVFFWRKDVLYMMDPSSASEPIRKVTDMPVGLKGQVFTGSITTSDDSIIWWNEDSWLKLTEEQQKKDFDKDVAYGLTGDNKISKIVSTGGDEYCYAILKTGEVRYLNSDSQSDEKLGLFRVFDPEIKVKTLIPDPDYSTRTPLVQKTDGSWLCTSTSLRPLEESKHRLETKPVSITGDLIDRLEGMISTTDGVWAADETLNRYNSKTGYYEPDRSVRNKISGVPKDVVFASQTVLLGKTDGVVLDYSSQSEPSNHAPYFDYKWSIDEKIKDFKGYDQWIRTGSGQIFVQGHDGELSICDGNAYSDAYIQSVSSDTPIDWARTKKIQIVSSAFSPETWGVFLATGELSFLSKDGDQMTPTTLEDSSVISKIWSADLDGGLTVIYETSGGLYRTSVPKQTNYAARPMNTFISWSPRSMNLQRQPDADGTMQICWIGGLMMIEGYVDTIDDDEYFRIDGVASGDHRSSIITTGEIGSVSADSRTDYALILHGRKGLIAFAKSKRDSDVWKSQALKTRTKPATQLPSITQATTQTALPALLVLPSWKEDEDEESLTPTSISMLAGKDGKGDRSFDFQVIDVPGLKPSGVYSGCYPSGTLDNMTGLITTDGSSIIEVKAGWNGTDWIHSQATIQQGFVPSLMTSASCESPTYWQGTIFTVAEDGSVVRLDRPVNGEWSPTSLGKIEGLASPTGSCGRSLSDSDARWDYGPLIWSSTNVFVSKDGKTLEDWTQDFQKFTQEEEKPNGN